MNETTPSLTALGTSLMRAIHTRRDARPLIDDPLSTEGLGSARARSAFRQGQPTFFSCWA